MWLMYLHADSSQHTLFAAVPSRQSTAARTHEPMATVPFTPAASAFPCHLRHRLPSFCRPIIDTAEFQRTRELIQLGAVRFVFQGAQHNRFSHMLGTAYQVDAVASMGACTRELCRDSNACMKAVLGNGKCLEVCNLVDVSEPASRARAL